MFVPPMRTSTGRLTLCVLLCALAACVGTSSAQSSSGIRYGIQDDAWLEFGPGTLNQRLVTFKRLGVPIVRFTLRWNRDRPATVRKTRPRRAIARTTGAGPTGFCAGFAATA